jgi:beta-mannosidase
VKEAVPLEDMDTWEWEAVKPPTDVLSHLRSTGKIPDPMVEQNDLLCRWVEDLDWAWRAEFTLPEGFLPADEDISLVLEEVDCYGEIFLNRTRVGTIANQFRAYRIDIEEFIRPGANELLIYLKSAKLVNAVLERVHGQLPSGFDTPRVHARRCQCLTGWDWAARMSSTSIMCVPYLEREQAHALRNPFVYVKELPAVEIGAATADHAILAVQVDLPAKRKASGVITLQVYSATEELVAEAQHPVNIKAGEATTRAVLRLENPALWWPLGLGEQPLYRLQMSLSATDRAGGTSTSTVSAHFGIRTATIERKKDAEGESFTALINGHPVFCRGANWIPVSMLPAEQNEEQYRGLVAAAAAAGMNCLRVWGGGLYEPDHFYRACDRLGILVWQDFMFACAAYPVYREFEDEVEAEARHQVKRLRNHPCLLIWCGNNENEWLHQIGELRKGNENNVIGVNLWRTELRGVVEELDPSRPYHQSSPFGKNKNDYNDEHTGDRHNWECWSRWQSPEAYMRDKGRFLSEFGFQGVPARDSIAQFAHDAQDMHHPVLIHHQKMIQGQERLARYMMELHRLPHDLDGWIEGTQQLQAEILRRAVEHWRRRKFNTAGALIWQLHDCYPAVSWALIDYYRRPKLAYEVSRRYFSPVLLSIALELGDGEVGAFPRESWALPHGDDPPEEEGSPLYHPEKRVAVYLVNDTSFDIAGELRLRFRRSSGEELTNEVSPLSAAANTNSPAAVVHISELRVWNLRDLYVSAEFTPDEASRQRIVQLEEQLHAGCAEHLPAGFSHFSRVDVQSALRSDALLVESKYFDWTDGITINGFARPSWYQPVAPSC